MKPADIPRSAQTIRNLFSSSLRCDLKKLNGKAKSNSDAWDNAVNREERVRADQMRKQLTHTQSHSSTAPGPTFPLHTVYIQEKNDFFGREAELDTLYKMLVENHTESKPIS